MSIDHNIVDNSIEYYGQIREKCDDERVGRMNFGRIWSPNYMIF